MARALVGMGHLESEREPVERKKCHTTTVLEGVFEMCTHSCLAKVKWDLADEDCSGQDGDWWDDSTEEGPCSEVSRKKAL